jgi:hypothetical protein
MRTSVTASIRLTALSKPDGFAGGAVVSVEATGERVVLVAEGAAVVALVVGAGGAVVVVVSVGGVTVVSDDSTPRAADGGGVRDAASSA